MIADKALQKLNAEKLRQQEIDQAEQKRIQGNLKKLESNRKTLVNAGAKPQPKKSQPTLAGLSGARPQAAAG